MKYRHVDTGQIYESDRQAYVHAWGKDDRLWRAVKKVWPDGTWRWTSVLDQNIEPYYGEPEEPLVADTVQEAQEPSPVLSPLLRKATYNVGRAIEYLAEAVLGEDAERIGNLLAGYAMLSDEIRRLSVTKEE